MMSVLEVKTNSRFRILSYKQPTTRFRIIFLCEYSIHVLTVMDIISRALLSQSFDCFPLRVRFIFLVELNVHPINKFAFLALFRMMSVLEVKSNSRFGRSPIIYPVTGILGVPSFLLPIMTSVPLWSQIFLSLLPVCLVTSHLLCYFPSGVFLCFSSGVSLCLSNGFIFHLEFFSQCEFFTPQ